MIKKLLPKKANEYAGNVSDIKLDDLFISHFAMLLKILIK